jgi:protein-S-isoprenylcysteine O-methyltransferase Ste14
MTRVLFFLYGVLAYLLFLVAILYGIGFVADLWWVPKGINDGVVEPVATAIVINVLLLLLFAVQHNVMARPWFKKWWTQFVPQPIERSTYVAAASLILMLLYWQWRPLPGIVWHVDTPEGRGLLSALYLIGWVLVFYSSFVIDHYELFGLKQVWSDLVGRQHVTAPFSERSIYRWVRHPLMLGFIVAFWSAPTMTWGRLLFAAVTTLWILIAIQIEERDLAHFLGQPYRAYRARTPMLVPYGRKSAADSPLTPADH